MKGLLSRPIALGVGVVGLLAWAVSALLAPAHAFQGWLIGFVFWSEVPLGALGLLLIHRLTGGEWGQAFAPELEPAAATAPMLLLFVLPLLAGLPLIYPWASEPHRVDASVRTLYLNPPLFMARTAVALLGWAAISRLLPRIEAPGGRLGAGLALCFHVIAGAVLAVDWVLSVRPQWTSSDFGMSFLITEFGLALAWAGLQERRRAPEGPAGDLGALMFAAALALSYLGFMAYIVVWYGDLPKPDGWFQARIHQGWGWLPPAILGAGFLGTTGLLAARGRLGATRSVAAAGVTLALGLLLYDVWLLAPAFGAACLGPGSLALVGMGGVWVAAVGGLPRLRSQVEALAHG